MHQPKVTSGPSEVVASGIVIAFGKNPITLEIGNLKFIFVFNDEDGKTEIDVKFDVTTDHELRITLSNFKNPLGTGNTEPIPIGKLQGRHLLLSYRVYDLQGSDKTLHYTFYMGEAAK